MGAIGAHVLQAICAIMCLGSGIGTGMIANWFRTHSRYRNLYLVSGIIVDMVSMPMAYLLDHNSGSAHGFDTWTTALLFMAAAGVGTLLWPRRTQPVRRAGHQA